MLKNCLLLKKTSHYPSFWLVIYINFLVVYFLHVKLIFTKSHISLKKKNYWKFLIYGTSIFCNFSVREIREERMLKNESNGIFNNASANFISCLTTEFIWISITCTSVVFTNKYEYPRKCIRIKNKTSVLAREK